MLGKGLEVADGLQPLAGLRGVELGTRFQRLFEFLEKLHANGNTRFQLLRLGFRDQLLEIPDTDFVVFILQAQERHQVRRYPGAQPSLTP